MPTYYVPTPASNWPLNGDFNDIVGSNSFTPIGGPTFVSGPSGLEVQAALFDGATQYAEKTSPTGLWSGNYPFTFSGFFRNDRIPFSGGNYAQAAIEFGNVAAHQSVALSIINGTVNIGPSWNGEGLATSANGLAQGTWYHLAVTYSGSTIKIFINGLKVNEASVGYSAIVQNLIFIGRALAGDPWSQWWQGAICKLKVWNQELTEGQVATLYAEDSATVPSWRPGYPQVAFPSAHAVLFKVETDQDSTAYFVTLPYGASSPDSNHVMNGQDATGGSLFTGFYGNTVLTGLVEGSLTATNLTMNTTYDNYFVARNSVGLQAAPVMITATATQLSYFLASSVTDGSSVASFSDSSALVSRIQATIPDTYFDATSKIYKTIVTYLHQAGRERVKISHYPSSLAGSVTWNPGARDGTWQKTTIKVYDPNGATHILSRSDIGIYEDIIHSDGTMILGM